MTRRLVEHARAKLPDVVMRTTLIVGYPGETDAQFRTLLDFVEEMAFDHVGVFTYSAEDGTPAARLAERVPAAIAEERRNAIMAAQQGISLRKNRALVGRTEQILIEAVGEAEDAAGGVEPVSVGRARRHAPEVDGLVFVPGALPVGAMVDLEIAEAGPYDLWAVPPGVVGAATTGLAAARAARRRRVPATRSRGANRPERRGQGRPVPMTTPAGT